MRSCNLKNSPCSKRCFNKLFVFILFLCLFCNLAEFSRFFKLLLDGSPVILVVKVADGHNWVPREQQGVPWRYKLAEPTSGFCLGWQLTLAHPALNCRWSLAKDMNSKVHFNFCKVPFTERDVQQARSNFQFLSSIQLQ